jgi:hypothetical protein
MKQEDISARHGNWLLLSTTILALRDPFSLCDKNNPPFASESATKALEILGANLIVSRDEKECRTHLAYREEWE